MGPDIAGGDGVLLRSLTARRRREGGDGKASTLPGAAGTGEEAPAGCLPFGREEAAAAVVLKASSKCASRHCGWSGASASSAAVAGCISPMYANQRLGHRLTAR